MNSSRYFRRSVLCAALGLGLSSLAITPAFAGNNDGSVTGHTRPGATVTVVNPATGLTRSVVAGNDGNYRLPLLPEPYRFHLQKKVLFHPDDKYPHPQDKEDIRGVFPDYLHRLSSQSVF